MNVIREIMRRIVVTIAPDATLGEAARILCENEVFGAPVADTSGALIGFISETDLMDLLFDTDARRYPVTNYMAREVHVVGPDDSLAAAAKMLALLGIRHLPVVEGGTLVGMVTRRELLKYGLHSRELLTDPLVELIPGIESMS
jgi:CBS domain-containing protein